MLLANLRAKQDLSLKWSAWKGFIPHLQWKSPSPKQKFGQKKNGSEKILGLKTFDQKKLWVQKILGPNKFNVLKFSKKIVYEKKFPKKILC